MEKGAHLSHAAIVARYFRKPCIICIKTDQFQAAIMQFLTRKMNGYFIEYNILTIRTAKAFFLLKTIKSIKHIKIR